METRMHCELNTGSLERIVPDEIRTEGATASGTLKLHFERYAFAKQNLVPGTLLDMACGVGYGTAMLALENPQISKAVGVDVSPAAVDYARQRYAGGPVIYESGDALTYSPGFLFDNIVSLETVEHVENPARLFARFSGLLAPGGRLIASVPVTPSVDANPHHKNNFTVNTFRKLAVPHSLKLVGRMDQTQPFSPFALARKTEPRANDLRPDMARFYLQHPSHFFLRVWSTLTDGFVNKYVTLVWARER
jgi:SAM-dependent methyltransferase